MNMSSVRPCVVEPCSWGLGETFEPPGPGATVLPIVVEKEAAGVKLVDVVPLLPVIQDDVEVLALPPVRRPRHLAVAASSQVLILVGLPLPLRHEMSCLFRVTET
jgi:hypothetical protein